MGEKTAVSSSRRKNIAVELPKYPFIYLSIYLFTYLYI